MLNRESILQMKDLPEKEVEVPEWGGSVFVRGMNGNERDKIEGRFIAAQKAGNDLTGVRAELVAMLCTDSEGNRLFEDEDTDALAEKSGAALDKLFTAALELSGMASKDLESAEKN